MNKGVTWQVWTAADKQEDEDDCGWTGTQTVGEIKDLQELNQGSHLRRSNLLQCIWFCISVVAQELQRLGTLGR